MSKMPPFNSSSADDADEKSVLTLLQQEDYNREACTPLKQIIKQNVISVYRTPILLLPYILSNLYICRARILYLLTKGQMEASASRILVKESLIIRQTKR